MLGVGGKQREFPALMRLLSGGFLVKYTYRNVHCLLERKRPISYQGVALESVGGRTDEPATGQFKDSYGVPKLLVVATRSRRRGTWGSGKDRKREVLINLSRLL